MQVGGRKNFAVCCMGKDKTMYDFKSALVFLVHKDEITSTRKLQSLLLVR